MRRRDDPPDSGAQLRPPLGVDTSIDFFISYSPHDGRWATWIAWQLELEGHRTFLQAWDFVPGTDFIDFMDRGVRNAAVVVAVLSRNYLKSRYGRMEWQAALRTDPGKLVTVRVDDCKLDSLLATITYLDLLEITDPAVAQEKLLSGLRTVLAGRAKPVQQPGFPGSRTPLEGLHPQPGNPQPDNLLAGEPPQSRHPGEPTPRERLHSRRAPAMPPPYPPAGPSRLGSRETITLLHVPGPRFGRGAASTGEPVTPRALQERIWANVTQLTDANVAHPDLILVTGDLMESGRPRERDDALTFLTGLRALLGVEPDRLIIVPGGRDVSKTACHGYFLQCEARDEQPQQPYFPKLEHYAQLFAELYDGLDGPLFDIAQPWTLFAVPELRVAVAGLNSTMALTHRPEDDYGWIGEAQAAWFAKWLRRFDDSGWLRIGIVRHDPDPGGGSVGADSALLRDAGTLDRLLGRRLNLLLHGPGPGGASHGMLASGLVVVPAAGPGQEEIIQVSPEGLRRFSAYGAAAAEQPVLIEHKWHAVGGAFATTTQQELAAGDGEFTAAAEQSEPTPLADPHSLFLGRIEEVCKTRYERVQILRVETDPPHLLVTRQEGELNPQWRVGAHVGELSRDAVDGFLRYEPGPGSELVYEGPPPARELREEALRRGVRVRSFLEFQGLLDLGGYLGKQTNRLRLDPRYPPDLYVPQRFRELDGSDPGIRDDLAEELIDLVTADYARFVLLLGDFGGGKTFALREVARRIAETTPHLIPILIELRGLDKAHTVHGLVAAHLANDNEGLANFKAFDYMLREGRIILLFDGFDELVTRLTYDRAAEHLHTLLEAVEDQAKIVVASRTQHFKSTAQVLTALGQRVDLLPHRRILTVEGFTSTQIRRYLVNRFGGNQHKADSRLGLIREIQNLLDLAQNPRMLSFIAELEEDRLRAAADARNKISAAGLYRQILESWLSYEANRAASPGAPTTLRLDDLRKAVTTLALRLWEAGESHLRLPALTEVAKTLSGLAGGQLSADQAAFAMGRDSLLVRTEEEQFGFIHSSVVEWLVADTIAEQLNSGVFAPPQLHQRPLSPLTVAFLCDLADTRACQVWADSVSASADATEAARTNAYKVSARLRIQPTADMRGAPLRGEDLSYRDLRGVDFTEADLTGASLVGANLRGAILRDARLVRARLDEAQLSGADLTGAQLRHARLFRVDLTGVTMTGSRWSRAALIDATGVPDARQLRGAAVAPGDPVKAEFAPASIGVRHGFHAELGRLPQVLDYSPDGDLLAIGSDGGGVLICDTSTGLPVRTLHGHRGRVFTVAYSEDVLVTGSDDGTVRIWDAATGDCRHLLAGHEQWSWPVTISPSGRELATGDANGVLRLWDLTSGSLQRELPAGHGLIFSLAFTGPLIAAAYRDGRVLLWDTAIGEVRGELTGATGSVYRVAVRPGREDLLATGGSAGAVRLWDPATGRQCAELRGHTGRVYTLAFHPQEPLLASGDTDGGVRLWDTATGRLRHQLNGHEAAIYAVVFSPSGDLLATGDSAGVVRLWDPSTGRLRQALSGHTGSVWPFVFRPDGGQLAISDDQFSTRLWDPSTGECRKTLTGHGRQVTSVRFSAASSLLATSGNDGLVRLWDPVTGRQQGTPIGSENRLIKLEAAIFSPTANRLVTVGNDRRLNLLNLDDDRYERYLDIESAPIWAVAFSPSGNELATANDDDTVRVWYRTTGRLVHTLEPHHGRVRSIAFSADGSVIATGCDDRMVRLWDAASGRLIRTLEGHTDRVYAVDFAGDLLASASWDMTARVWDVESGQTRHVLRRHTGRLWTAAFSPAGDLLATAGDDLVVRLWDPSSGAHRHTLTGHTRSVWSVTFSPSGQFLAAGGADGTARLWSLTDEQEPTAWLTLLGLPEGWAALAPDGRYKREKDVGGQFWHVIGMCRFEVGELDQYLSEVRQLPPDAPF